MDRDEGREPAGSPTRQIRMPDLAALLAELTCGDDGRAEAAALALPAYGEQALAALRPLLRASQADTRWWAVRALAQFDTSHDLTGDLLQALGDEADEVRQCSAMSLARHPDPQAVLALVGSLSDRDAMTAALARSALVAIGADAVAALIELLDNGSRPAKLEAVRALAEIKDPRAIPALMKTFGEDSTIMHYWAEQGLGRLGLGMVYIKPE